MGALKNLRLPADFAATGSTVGKAAGRATGEADSGVKAVA
jgi:hypothetical protein